MIVEQMNNTSLKVIRDRIVGIFKRDFCHYLNRILCQLRQAEEHKDHLLYFHIFCSFVFKREWEGGLSFQMWIENFASISYPYGRDIFLGFIICIFLVSRKERRKEKLLEKGKAPSWDLIVFKSPWCESPRVDPSVLVDWMVPVG